MSSPTLSKLDELLIDDAIWGLSDEERAQLANELQGASQDVDIGWQRVAAMATVALQADAVPPPSEALLNKLRQDAPLPASRRAVVVSGPGPYVNVMLAAALLLLGVFLWLDRSGHGELSPRDLRDSLIATGSATVWGWAGDAFQGDVVWDADSQRGAMRFVGLQANDPGKQQYQLWIFDGDRNQAYPVDGGVFDIPQGQTEMIIPIDAKILVHDAKAFVITMEPPGGVVVSDRKRIVGQAKSM